MMIPYQIAKFKPANTVAKQIWAQLPKFNQIPNNISTAAI